MKIQAVKPYLYTPSNKNINKNINKNSVSSKSMELPNYTHFLGGYSVNLSETYKNLKEDEYPRDIKSMVENTLSQGNPEYKTLYDIHFEKYKGILDCYSLKELKEKYPEFRDVKSIYEVECIPDSFAGRFLSGQDELFAQDEDLTLQLIKLYWGQGFSQSDISKYILNNSKNKKAISLQYLMTKKLNIPMMNAKYASVLKLSNREYNKNYTSQMSIKLKEAKEARLQKQEGEPVIIPKGVLSQAHREHISQGLIRYYQEHPEACFNLTRRQKEFYIEHPEKLDEISVAMRYAWNKTQEGVSVKKYLSKFMKKTGFLNLRQLTMQEELTSAQSKAMREFWSKNPWARTNFSKALTKGWQYAKDDIWTRFDGTSREGEKITINLMPKKVVEEFYSDEKIPDLIIRRPFSIGAVVIFQKDSDAELKTKDEVELFKKLDDYTGKLIHQNETIANCIADAKLQTILTLAQALEKNSPDLPQSLRDDEVQNGDTIFPSLGQMKAIVILKGIEEELRELGALSETHPTARVTRNLDNGELNRILYRIALDAMTFGCVDIAEYINKNIDEYYERFSNMRMKNTK